MFEYDFETVMDPAGIELHPLGVDEMLVALPPGHSMAGREVVPMAQLSGETWISSADTPATGCSRTAPAARASRRASRSPRTTTAPSGGW